MDIDMKGNAALVFVLASLTLHFAGGPTQAAAVTTVRGSVHDGAGNAVTHAYVEAIPVIGRNGGGTVGNLQNPWIPADGSGAFTLSLAPGRYRLRAKDEVDGYPDPSFGVKLDTKARFPEIEVDNQEIQNVEVILGTRGGTLAGELRDAQTLKPISGAKIRIQDARNPGAYVEVFTNGNGH